MGSFSDSINKNIARVLDEVDKKCYSITWQLFTSVVQLSPSPNHPGETAKGLLANQWYPKVGEFSSELTAATSPYGSDSLARITSLANNKIFFGKDAVVTMANNVPYAYRAEVLGWPSPQWSGRVAPYRMVAQSLLKVATLNK